MDLILRRLQAVIFALASGDGPSGHFKKIDPMGMGKLRMDWF